MVNILGDDPSVKPHYTIDSLTISGKRKFINIEENFSEHECSIISSIKFELISFIINGYNV